MGLICQIAAEELLLPLSISQLDCLEVTKLSMPFLKSIKEGEKKKALIVSNQFYLYKMTNVMK